MKKIQNSYKKSGVNICIANKFVDHIAKISKKNVKKTDSSFNNSNIGAFGSVFDISNIKIKDPVIYKTLIKIWCKETSGLIFFNHCTGLEK